MAHPQQSLPVSAEAFKARIAARTARIGVVGLGYVGLPLVLLYSEQKFAITGFDIDRKKVDTLNGGGSYIYRILPAEVQQAQQQGFAATAEFARIAEMDAVVICVPTPLNEHHEPDLSYIVKTGESIGPYVHEGQLVILESTTYPGTTEEVLVPILEQKSGLKAARAGTAAAGEFLVAFSPEREDPGNDTVARCDIPKVVGGLNPTATE